MWARVERAAVRGDAKAPYAVRFTVLTRGLELEDAGGHARGSQGLLDQVGVVRSAGLAPEAGARCRGRPWVTY